MRMSEAVEWSIHCCTVLATLPEDQALPAARLAEFHDVPPAYLAKALQALCAAGITVSRSGPGGGYRLARPADAVSVLDIVRAVDGPGNAFRCSEIRRRGPGASDAGDAYRQPCGIAVTMWRAEEAWRAELAATSIAELLEELVATVPKDQLTRGAEWIQAVTITRRNPA
jgi:Rrf2 family protein